jgi:16S rRNA pseudouridine516 synthase
LPPALTLTKALARGLDVPRKEVDFLFRKGLITDVDGGPVDPDARLPEGGLTVIVDGEPLDLRDSSHVLLHKPLGVVTALRDDVHATAADHVIDAPLGHELRPVGRLDKDTSGLLLWTTDGPLLQHLCHPKRAFRRRYHAALARPWTDPTGELVLRDGYAPNIEVLRPLRRDEVHPALVVPDGAALFAELTVTAGAYHEVRRIFAALGSHVDALCRVQFGPVELPVDLAAGEWLEVDLLGSSGADYRLASRISRTFRSKTSGGTGFWRKTTPGSRTPWWTMVSPA